MDLRQLLFSFKGRIGRLYWWVASIAAGAIGGMLTTILEVAAKAAGEGAINPDTQQFEPTSPYGIAVSIVGLFNMWIAYALMVKRLHDRDRTGWWVVVPLVAILVAILIGLAALATPKEQPPSLVAATVVACVAAILFGFWLFIEIGFLPGTRGPNRFGSDPLGVTQEDAKL